jgi:hypothetical protein
LHLPAATQWILIAADEIKKSHYAESAGKLGFAMESYWRHRSVPVMTGGHVGIKDSPRLLVRITLDGEIIDAARKAAERMATFTLN